MQPPIGSSSFCDTFQQKKLDKAGNILSAISELPDPRCALFLLRYQTSRMDYIARTTPLDSCKSALERFDSGSRACFEHVIGISTSDSQWAQAALPSRHSGLGLRSAYFHADAAYVASRASTAVLCNNIWTEMTASTDDWLHDSVARINARVPDVSCHLSVGDGLENFPRQQVISDRLARAEMERLQQNVSPYDKARINAYSAPGVGRWLSLAPSRTLDKHLSSRDVFTTVALHLGVDVHGGGALCRFCAAALDTKGVHPGSCTAGGDINFRHHGVRDRLYGWAARGRMQPQLEKAGLLADDAIVMLSRRRPADVLVRSPGSSAMNSAKVA